MAYNEASFQLKMMLSSESPRTKFLLLIDYLRKPPAIQYKTQCLIYCIAPPLQHWKLILVKCDVALGNTVGVVHLTGIKLEN